MVKIVKIVFLVILLMMVRAFEESLFYDPFIGYFKRFLTDSSLPTYNTLTLIAYVFLRYLLNAVLSIALLYVFFDKKSMVKFAAVFYSVVFVVLLLVFWILLQQLLPENVMPFFYVRRFLIHPIFILILLPAFYYQQIQPEK